MMLHLWCKRSCLAANSVMLRINDVGFAQRCCNFVANLVTATREVVGRFLVGSWSVFAEYLQSQFLDIILYFSYTILRNTFSEGVTYGPPTTVNSAGGVSFRKSDVQSPAVF